MIFDKLLGRHKSEEYVRYGTLGVGIVVEKKSMGFRLLVHFPDGIVRKMRSDEVTYITKEEFDQYLAPRTSIASRTTLNELNEEQATITSGVKDRLLTNDEKEPQKKTSSESPKTEQCLEPVPSQLDGSILQNEPVIETTKMAAKAEVVTEGLKESPEQHNLEGEKPRGIKSHLKTSHCMYVKSSEGFHARQVIESLRLGIPPQGVSDDFFDIFTVGREEEIERIKEFLDNEEEGSLITTGEYGSGKTHMMELTASIALRQGWAVSIVELDTTEAPFSRPKSVYERIVKSLRYMKDGHLQDFRSMLNDAAVSENYKNIMDHQYLNKIIHLIREDAIAEPYYIWIEGSGNRKYPFFDVDQNNWRAYEDKSYPPMHYEMTSASIYCNILNGIGFLSPDLLDLKGLLILFDEAESVDHGYYTNHAADMGFNFVRGLDGVASNDSDLFDESKDLGTNVDLDGIGRKTGLRYSRQRQSGRNPLGFVYSSPSKIKTVYCFTPVEDILSLDPFCHMDKILLRPVGRNYSRQIWDNVSEYYSLAYDFDSDGLVSNDDEIVRNVFNDGLRMGIKGAVEILDVVRLKNDDPGGA